MMPAGDSRKILLGALLLAILTLLALGRVVWHDFVDFDDGTYVSANPKVLHGLSIGGIAWAFATRHANNWHPLTWISLMTDATLFGKTAFGFHFTNLVLHLANVILLFILFQRLTGSVWKSWTVAALFGIHPLHVESVAWISERKDVLSTFFWMLVLLSYVKYVELRRKGSSQSLVAYFLLVLLFLLGLMAKPMLVTLPFVLLLLDFWPLGRMSVGFLQTDRATNVKIDARSQDSLKTLILEKTPLIVLSALSCVITVVAQGGAVSRFDKFPLGIRLANAIVSYVGYVGKMIWPSDLQPFYVHRGTDIPIWEVGFSGAVLALAVALAMKRVKTQPYLTFGLLWYIGTLVPVIGIVQVGAQGMADRYTYVPLIGLFVSIVWAIREATATLGKSSRSLLRVLTGLVVGVLAFRTFVQAGYWRNTVTLFEHTLAISPDNYLAHNNLGIALEKRGRLEEAALHYQRAIELRPSHAQAHNNLGNIFLRLGKVGEAIEQYELALDYRPDDAIIRNNLGYALARVGRREEAIGQFRRALKQDPDNVQVLLNLGSALLRKGEIGESIRYLSKAVRLQPGLTRAHLNLGVAMQMTGAQAQAIAHFREAVRLSPQSGDAHLNLGVALFKQGDIDGASREFARAIEIRPSDPKAYEYLAVALYHKGRYGDAWSAIKMSQKLGGKPDPRFIMALSKKMS